MPKKQTPTDFDPTLTGISADLKTADLSPTRKRTTSLSGMLATETPETQKMLKDIASMVEVFKTEINEDPAIVAYLIKKINPLFGTNEFIGALMIVQEAYDSQFSQPGTVADMLSILIKTDKSINHIFNINQFWDAIFNITASTFLPSLSWNKIVLLGAYIQTLNN